MLKKTTFINISVENLKKRINKARKNTGVSIFFALRQCYLGGVFTAVIKGKR